MNRILLLLILLSNIRVSAQMAPALLPNRTEVNSHAQMSQQPNMEVCQGSQVGAIIFSATAPGGQFSWTNNQPAIGLVTSGSGQIPSFTAQLPDTSTLVASIQVTETLNGVAIQQYIFTITVHPTPVVFQPQSQSLCTGAATSAVIFETIPSAAICTWTNDLPNIGLMQQGTGHIPAFNVVNFGSAVSTANISVIPVLANCQGAPVNFSFTVFPLANVIQPLNQFLCNGEETMPVNFIGTSSGTSFNWTNDNPSIGLAIGGTGSVPSFTAINSGNIRVAANITVTAIANNCAGVSRTFRIYVDPTPDMLQPENISVCAGMSVTPAAFSASVAGTEFTWINSAASIGLPASGTGQLSSFVAENRSAFPVTAIISVTGFANSCASVTKVFTITVYPQPVVDSVIGQSLCNGNSTSNIHFTGTHAGNGFIWMNDQPSVGLSSNGTGDIPSFTAINTGSDTVVALIQVNGVNPGCTGQSRQFSITVHPTPNLQATPDTRLCRGDRLSLSASNAVSYSWSPSQYLSCTQCADPVTSATGTIEYQVTGQSAFGCTGTDTVKITVVQRFNMQASASDTTCRGSSIQLNASGAASYQWWPETGLNQADIANPLATPDSTTRYRVVARDADHCFTDTAYVTVTVGPRPVVDLGPDISSSPGSQVNLSPQIQQGPVVSWNWSPVAGLSCFDCPSPVLSVTQASTVVLSVQNAYGCTGSDTILVNSLCKGSQAFVPNAFTPDGDGLNDKLMIRGIGIRVKSFRIYNRWGNLVFEKLQCAANDPQSGWDGRVRGVPATPDVFIYTAEVLCDNGIVQTLKGNTTIIR